MTEVNYETFRLKEEIDRLRRELAEVWAYNESQAASTSKLWDILAPEYEGDKSIHEVAEKLINEVSEERIVKRKVTDKFADYCIERNEHVKQLATERERADKEEQARIHVAKAAGGYLDRAEKAEASNAILTADRSALLEFIHGLSDEFKLSSHFPHPTVHRWGEMHAADALLTEMQGLKAKASSSEAALRIAREERDTQASGAAALRKALQYIHGILDGHGEHINNWGMHRWPEARECAGLALASTTAGSGILRKSGTMQCCDPIIDSNIGALRERITQLEAALAKLHNLLNGQGPGTPNTRHDLMLEITKVALAAPVAQEAGGKEKP